MKLRTTFLACTIWFTFAFVACAADEVVMSPGSKYMIHKAWSLAIGNADDMRALAALLDKCDATMIAEYVRRSGNDTQKVTDWCAAETWFDAQEAVAAGFADSVAETAKAAAKAQAAPWNLRAYQNAPKDVPEPADAAVAAAVQFALDAEEAEASHHAFRARAVKAPAASPIV